MGRTRFAGREYISAPLLLKTRRLRVKGHLYYQHYLYLPRRVALKVYEMADRKPGQEVPLIVLLAPADWYHVLAWKPMDWVWPKLPERTRLELEALGLGPKPTPEVVTVLATREEVEKLGIDVEKPITLKELARRLGKEI